MNKFLSKAIRDSGNTKADVARNLGITPQAVGNTVRAKEPRPSSVAEILLACGWSIAEVKELSLGAVYEIPATNGNPAP